MLFHNSIVFFNEKQISRNHFCQKGSLINFIDLNLRRINFLNERLL